MDTLTYNGVEKSLSDWGFKFGSVTGEKFNQAPDKFNATIAKTTIAAEAASPTFPFESQITVRTNRTYDTLSSMYVGGTVKFQGKRVGQPMKADSSGQGVTYKFEGPWYDLSNTNYQQAFQGPSGPVILAETVMFTYNQGFNFGGTQFYYGVISVGDQIQAVLQWLLDQYAAQGMAAPFQFVGHDLGSSATISPNNYGGFYSWPITGTPTISRDLFNLFLPSFITKPIFCSEAIKKCLELIPRANCWFDHTTVPPTFHVTTPADKRSVTLPLFDGTSHKSIDIQRRDDLLARSVNVVYRLNNTVNGVQQIAYVVDNAGGLATGLRVVNELLDLQGTNTTTVKAHLDVEPIQAWASQTGQPLNTQPDHVLKRAWWGSKRGGEAVRMEPTDLRVRFQDKNQDATYIPDATIINSAPLYDPTGVILIAPAGTALSAAQLIQAGFVNAAGQLTLNRVVRGTFNSWMTNPDGTQTTAGKFKVSAKMTFATYDTPSSVAYPGSETDDGPTGSIRHTMHVSEEVSANLELTNGVTGSYSTIASRTPGEGYITGAGGIAAYLYNHLNAYQYDGDAVHVVAEFVDSNDPTYVDLGCALNLSNGAAMWTNMNAQIQSIKENYSTHETTVQIGVAKHLNAGQLSSLLQMWRNRRTWYNPSIRTNNQQGATGTVDTAVANGGQNNTVDGVIMYGIAQNIDYATLPNGSEPGEASGLINHDPTKITAALAAVVSAGKTPTPVSGASAADIKTVQPREVLMCDSSGNQFYAIVHMTAGYTKVKKV